MRIILAALAALLALASSPVHASFTQDDRYFDSRVVPKNVQQNVRKSVHNKVRHVRHRARNSVTKSVLVPRLKYRRITWQRQAALPRAAAIEDHSGARPRDKRGRLLPWCGWWLGKVLGLPDRALWLARNWATVGTALTHPVPGAIAVWRHHVGKITAVAPGRIKLLSGNDGHAVRDRWRSARGVIAYRAL